STLQDSLVRRARPVDRRPGLPHEWGESLAKDLRMSASRTRDPSGHAAETAATLAALVDREVHCWRSREGCRRFRTTDPSPAPAASRDEAPESWRPTV